MKKFIFITTLCVAMLSCTKFNTTPSDMVTISFTETFVESHTITRADGNVYLNTIASDTPEYLNVTLTNNESGEMFTCKSNENITVPSGNYVVSAEYTDTEFTKPNLKANTVNINITKETPSVELDVFYNCYAVFALTSECKACHYRKAPDSLYDISFTKFDEVFVGYFNDDRRIKLTPLDDNDDFIQTVYEFSTTKTDGKVYAEYGKYYVIHPNPNPNTTSSFITQIPTMTEGEL